MKKEHDCKKCVFCLSKCPYCSNTDVTIDVKNFGHHYHCDNTVQDKLTFEMIKRLPKEYSCMITCKKCGRTHKSITLYDLIKNWFDQQATKVDKNGKAHYIFNPDMIEFECEAEPKEKRIKITTVQTSKYIKTTTSYDGEVVTLENLK